MIALGTYLRQYKYVEIASKIEKFMGIWKRLTVCVGSVTSSTSRPMVLFRRGKSTQPKNRMQRNARQDREKS